MEVNLILWTLMYRIAFEFFCFNYLGYLFYIKKKKYLEFPLQLNEIGIKTNPSLGGTTRNVKL